MDKQTKKIIGIVVIVVIVIFSLYFIWGFLQYKYVSENSGLQGGDRWTEIDFLMDNISKSLVVDHIFSESENLPLLWEDITIATGTATLPTGTIDEGDIITNCNGSLILIYTPENLMFGPWDFSE